MDYFSSNFKLGILGGGQLGKMLLNETRKFDIYPSVLDNSDEAPCKIGSNEFHKGDLLDFETVYNFGKTVDVLTIEIENVNADALEKLEKEGRIPLARAQYYKAMRLAEGQQKLEIRSKYQSLRTLKKRR